jgi:hypothetical protein
MGAGGGAEGPFRFRFVYPANIVDEAILPGTHRYCISSEDLFSEQLSRDDGGVVVREYRAQG